MSFRLSLVVCVFALSASAAGPGLFPDDPIARDDDMALDAGNAVPVAGSNGYDFAEHTFMKVGDRPRHPAVNVNTLDEVTDSRCSQPHWRSRNWTSDKIVRGQNRPTSSSSGWEDVQERAPASLPPV